MKKIIILAVLFIMVSAAGVGFAGEKPINSNPGFDLMENNLPQFWSYIGWFKPEVSFLVDNNVKHSGKASGSIKISEITKRLSEFGPPNWAQDIVANIPVGKKVKLTAYIKSKDLMGFSAIAVQCLDKEGKLVGFGTTQNTHVINGTMDWKEVEFTLDVPPETVKMRILCMIGGQGQVWFDEVKLQKMGASQ